MFATEEIALFFTMTKSISVGDCGKTGKENGDMECSNIGVRKGTYDAVKLEKGEKSQVVRSYNDVTMASIPIQNNYEVKCYWCIVLCFLLT